MRSGNRVAGSGIFTSMLAILFIGLKLTGHIDWSWWWVLLPLWFPVALGLVFAAVGLLFVGRR